LVLAAGRGQRLRPLTGFVPKPLLPVLGRPVLEHTLARLAGLGCKAVAINLHHLGDLVSATIGPSFQGMAITYSREKELLGTLGAFSPLREFFAPADLVILINGDSLCRWPLGPLVRHHRGSGAEATLLVSERADPGRYGGGIGLDGEGQIVDFAPPISLGGESPVSAAQRVERRVFAGAHVLAPELLDRVATAPLGAVERKEIVPDLYQPLLAEGARLVAFSTKARWHDLGTPRRYLDGVLDWARGRGPMRMVKTRHTEQGAKVAGGARVRRSVLETEVEVEKGAVVEDSVVLAGARIGARSRLRHSLVAPGVELPAESKIEGRLVTPLRAGRDPGARDSVVGRLVFTPIDPPS
jgi:NDP-sugar pyrophosphorylase family protein